MVLFPNGLKGLGDSKWSGILGSVYRMVGIDIHSTPGLIKVHQKLSKASGSTIAELCKVAINCSDGSRLWFSSESGKIWRESSGTYTLKHTTVPTSGEAKCLGAHEFDNWIYWATESYLHRIHVDDIAGTWSSFLYQNYQAFTKGDDTYHPMVEQNLELFIGDKTIIAKVTDPSTATPSQSGTMTTTLGSSVKWLSFGGRVKPSENAFPKLIGTSVRAEYPEADTYSFDVLAVAGGGGGGGGGAGSGVSGGGGGAGGVVADTLTGIAEGSYAITVGAGGAAGTGGVSATNGDNGADSSFAASVVATGGGGGGSSAEAPTVGGSGGGGANNAPGAAGTAGQGNAGGESDNSGVKGGGGGGGAGAVGGDGTAAVGGAGGAGTSSSISGSAVNYGGGGGGGGSASSGGAGGGGGGAATGNATAGTANTGGGGGGGGTTNGNGGAGGSGVVIISYTTGSMNATGGTISTAGGKTIHTFNSSGTFTITRTTLTKAITVPAGHNKVLVVVAANYTDVLPASATFNGVAMTLENAETFDMSGGDDMSYGVFRLVNPAVTTGDVVVTWASATSGMVFHAFVFDGADQTTPLTGITENTDSLGSTSVTAIGADSTLSYYTRFAMTISPTAMHTIPSDQTQIQADTNFVGNDSSSYEGVTENFGWTAETDFNIKDPERITALIDFDVDILVGTKRVNIGRVLRWPTDGESWSAQDTLEEAGVNAFIRDDNYVYVSAGDFGRFYFYNGEKLEPFKRIPGDWSPTKKAIIHANAVAFLLGVPVFGLSNSTGNPALQGVYSFGSYSKDYLKVLDLSFPISSGSTTGVTIGAIIVDGADLYVAWKDGSSVGVDKLDYAAKYASAYIETLQLTSPEDRSELKTALEFLADYASLPANTSITFGYKKAYEGSFTSLTSVKDTKLAQVRAKASVPEVASLQARLDFTVSTNDAPEIENVAVRWANEKR